ncbi:MAG: Ldh family oxidoreductase [Pseudomonadota bacterium]
MTDRHPAAALVALARVLLEDAGLEPAKAAVVAEVLVEADLLGHDTHGLQLLLPYLGALDAGTMTASGAVDVVSDRGAVALWDGRWLPGVWLTAAAVDEAVARAGRYGTATITIRHSHHIACLAAFLERATRHGMMVHLASSDPSAASVAPHGGRRAVMTPNPIGIGIPTADEPILIDVSTSITTNGMSGRLAKEGRRFDHPWLVDASGNATDDPTVLQADPRGAILPVGGLDHGHKGYALGLWVEAMTQALGGFGRADAPDRWGAAVFVQVTDPRAFAGDEAFRRQSDWLAAACRATPTAPDTEAVRLPGERALAHKRAALVDGVALYPGILEGLRAETVRRGLDWPSALAG